MSVPENQNDVENDDDYEDYDSDEDEEESWHADDDFSGLDKGAIVRMAEGLGAFSKIQEGVPLLLSYSKVLGIDVARMVEIFSTAPGNYPPIVNALLTSEEQTQLGITSLGSAVDLQSTSKLTRSPASVAAAKGRNYHGSFFYPKRCERNDCDITDNLLVCSSCKMVCYCCQEHQKADWPLHKDECKTFRRNVLKAFFYKDDEMLMRFPMTNENERNSFGEDRFRKKGYACPRIGCTICNCEEGAKRMMRTECCEQCICDTESEYVMFSYSRAHCSRSHNRYTLCGSHLGNCRDNSCDWRECPSCIQVEPSRLPDMLWRGLNPYNFYPLLSKDVPRHSLCDTCSKCRKKFLSGLEGCSYGSFGITCLGCSGMA